MHGGGSLLRRCASTCSKSSPLTTEAIVEQLSEYIVGQPEAKRAVAVAMRSRWRRMQLEPDLQREVTPFNILLAGSTGTGKTELSRRLAALAGAPFIKTEATKFTEVGIYGTDTSTMIKDLVDTAIEMERAALRAEVKGAAEEYADAVVLDALCGGSGGDGAAAAGSSSSSSSSSSDNDDGTAATRSLLRAQLAAGALDDRLVEVLLDASAPKKHALGKMAAADPNMQLPPQLQDMMASVTNMIGQKGGGADGDGGRKPTRLPVSEARRRLAGEDAERVVACEEEECVRRGLLNAEQNGIVFLDEIDKVATRSSDGGGGGGGGGGNFNKGEGVQKELLALTEGCSVATPHGMVQTDHMLFIASGACVRSLARDD